MSKRKLDGSSYEEQLANFTTGQAIEEEISFSWKIKNFLTVKCIPELINEQQISISAGKSHGYPTKWTFNLNKESGCIFTNLRLDSKPLNCRVIVNHSFQILKPNLTVGKARSVQLACFIEGFSTWGCSIPMDDAELNELIWEDGSINFKVNMKLLIFTPAVVMPTQVDLHNEIKGFQTREFETLKKSMTQMIRLDSRPAIGKIIKVVSKDGVEFYANTETLADRSPIFKAMFATGNWKEGQGSAEGDDAVARSLILEDLSGKTVNVLLHYMLGGVLLEDDWKAEDVILELTYAAEKYQLERLTDFLDKALPVIGFNGTEIMAKLALLTKRLGMNSAAKELFCMLKETAADIEQLVLNKEGNLSWKGLILHKIKMLSIFKLNVKFLDLGLFKYILTLKMCGKLID